MGTVARSAEPPAPRSRCGAWRLTQRVGEGATAVVWLARHAQTGQLGALKRAKEGADGAAAALLREAQVLARVGRRWGPALLDVGPGFLVTEWVEGVAVGARLEGLGGADRELLAAVVAHSVARALEELHQAGFHHGDVKAANVICAPDAPRAPPRDAADDRGATLIDLGLAGDLAAGALGGTPRYAAPELRDRAEAGPAADLWALGVLLAEILDPAVERSADPIATVGAWRSAPSEPARWAQALLAPAPGGRPSAQWVARRAARRLDLRVDEREAGRARIDRVRRAYLAQRAGETGSASSPAIGETARAWIEEAAAAARGLASPRAGSSKEGASGPSGASGGVLEPLGAVRRSRWLVALVGPSAAAWPLGVEDSGERALVERVVELARAREPASWTLEDVLGHGESSAHGWRVGDGPERASRLVRELARSAPNVEALAVAEDDVARGLGTSTLALQLAGALARAGETGRAWVALMGSGGPEVDALRAEISRRRGDEVEARRAAARAIASDDVEWSWSAKATLARLAWDAHDLEAADRLLEGTQGAPAAAVRALVALRRGAHDAGLRVVERALVESIDAEAQSRLEAVRGLLELGRGGHVAALAAFARAVELATRAGAVVDEATYLTSEAAAATDAGDLVSRARQRDARGAPVGAAGSPRTRGARLARASRGAGDDRGRARDRRGGRRGARARARVARRPGGRVRALGAGRGARTRRRGGARPGRSRRASACRVRGAKTSSAPRRGGWSGRPRPSMIAPSRRATWTRPARARATLGVVGLARAGPPRRPASRRRRRRARRAPVAPRRARAALVARADARRGGAPRDRARATATPRGASRSRGRPRRARCATGRPPSCAPRSPSRRVGARGRRRRGRRGVRAGAGRSRSRASCARCPRATACGRCSSRCSTRWCSGRASSGGSCSCARPTAASCPRAARNLARHDLEGEQLALSQTIARRAIETGDAVVATDALSTLGDVHASVHALRLRSVLAVPLLARGEALGVVYLDDRVRKGAFGPRELAWVRVVASQAAMAIADARDAVLLRRAARRAERARVRLEGLLARARGRARRDPHASSSSPATARENRYRYDEIAGRSEPMRDLLRLVDRVTASDVPVLVVGESGTGKELIARAIHANGARARRPFVTENCASVPESLLESTLFGHVRGAFTGASSTRAGLFDVADGGTLFLDEIGEMSLAMQAKLLRVLQDGEVRPVGSERARKRRRARHRRHAPRSRGDGRRGHVPRGPVLPAQRHHAPRAAAARAARGHPAARRALRHASTRPGAR